VREAPLSTNRPLIALELPFSIHPFLVRKKIPEKESSLEDYDLKAPLLH